MSTVIKIRPGNIKLDDDFTFTGVVSVGTPTSDGHAATKAYVDGATTALGNRIQKIANVSSAGATVSFASTVIDLTGNAPIAIFVNGQPIPVVSSLSGLSDSETEGCTLANNSGTLDVTFNVNQASGDTVFLSAHAAS
jgi:hypothetical protein